MNEKEIVEVLKANGFEEQTDEELKKFVLRASGDEIVAIIRESRVDVETWMMGECMLIANIGEGGNGDIGMEYSKKNLQTAIEAARDVLEDGGEW